MRFLLILSLLLGSPMLRAETAMLIQSSPLAGSQYYALDAQWSAMQVGDRLDLIRESGNQHDRNAIRIEWKGQKIGYVPRAENAPLAEAMDQGDRLHARISRLRPHPDPWQRVEFEVYLKL